MNLDLFENLVRSRRAVRKFESKPLAPELLERLLDAARWAPSGYNLQPTHFFVVTDPALKKKLSIACMSQKQIEQAPATVVFTGDKDVYQKNLDRMVQLEKEEGAINDQYEAVLRKYVKLAFDQGPCGLGWFGKVCCAPIFSFFKPTPDIPAIQKRNWVTKQVMLAAMNFMLAAKAAGLDTVPMEGFDENRVRRALGIPGRHVVPIVIPVGYSAPQDIKKTRLPLKSMVHLNRW